MQQNHRNMTIRLKETARWSFMGMLTGAFFLTTALSTETLAQPETKLRNDPTYSIHNYKHPNKATAARAWESEIVLGRQGRERRQIHMGDYKRLANREPGRSVLVIRPRRNRYTNPELVSGYNYKNPRPSRSVVRRESRRPAKPIVIVPADEAPTGQ